MDQKIGCWAHVGFHKCVSTCSPLTTRVNHIWQIINALLLSDLKNWALKGVRNFSVGKTNLQPATQRLCCCHSAALFLAWTNVEVTLPHGAMVSRRFQTSYCLHLQGSASPVSIPRSKRRDPNTEWRNVTTSTAPLTEPKSLQDGVQRLQNVSFVELCNSETKSFSLQHIFSISNCRHATRQSNLPLNIHIQLF
jgi:hypothetical protein